MRHRLPPSRALRAVALATAASCGALAASTGHAVPPGAIVAADLAGVPTSPAFRMDVRRSHHGAPETTPNGSRAVPTSSQDANLGNGDGTGARAGAAAASAASGVAASIDQLRERLAEKLGATHGGNGRFVMQVSNRGESGEHIVSAAPSGVATAAAAHRAAARLASAAASAPSAAQHPTQWDYSGPGGPEAWSRIQPGFAKCATGTRQSPIDIRDGIAVDLEPIRFDYRPGAFSVLDDGHTVQVDVEPGSSITVSGRRYELVQFHFHRPAEERIEGREFDMGVHLVHKDAEGRLAVIALLLERGGAQPVVQSVWNNLPLEKNEPARATLPLDLSSLLPEDKRYYTYMGSLTTPPCSEGVLWMVMKHPVPVSAEQVAIFAHLYPMNARPIQQSQGRLIKESN